MKENRWGKSMSIMDLNLSKRKVSLTSSLTGCSAASAVTLGSSNGGQSYELIKSTQVRPKFEVESESKNRNAYRYLRILVFFLFGHFENNCVQVF